MSRLPTLLAGILVTTSAALGQTLPIGDEFQVSTTTGAGADRVAVAPDGRFVVVMSSFGSSGTDSSDLSVQAQRFAADATKLGAEIQVNTYTTSFQWRSSVAIDAAGNFVVVWQSEGSSGTDSSESSIQGQRFAADGSPMGEEFQVNSDTTGPQRGAAVAMDGDGDFVVVWDSGPVKGQRFGADGSVLGGEFQVGTTTSIRTWPDVAFLGASGDFVVVWDTDDVDPDVLGQRFTADGSSLGGEFVVNPMSAVDNSYPAVAANPAGEFVVAWLNGTTSPYTHPFYIMGRTFDSGASPAGDFSVTSDFISRDPRVAIDSAGHFVVVWSTGEVSPNPPDGSYTSAQGQIFSFDASTLVDQFTVNVYTTGYQFHPSVAMDGTGNFVVVWTGPGARGRRFQSPSTIFTDDFESGDLLAWSATVP